MIFSTKDIKTIFGEFDQRRLHEWKHKGYLIALKQGWYIFSSVSREYTELMGIAGIQYKPSYISLYTALDWYGVIPETTITIQSITTRKTLTVHTSIATFEYRSCPPGRMVGLTLLESKLGDIQIATLEKAYLDVLWYDASLQTADDFSGLRIYHEEPGMVDEIAYKKYMLSYPVSFHSRAMRFLDYIQQIDFQKE